MKRIFLLTAVLCAFVAANVHATPQPLDIYGGYDPYSSPTWWYLTDYWGMALENCDCVGVYWNGPDGECDGIAYWKMPEPRGDDQLLTLTHIEYGSFYAGVTTYGPGEGHPEACEGIYVLLFDGSCEELAVCNYWAMSQQHHVANYMGEAMYCHFPGEGTFEHDPNW